MKIKEIQFSTTYKTNTKKQTSLTRTQKEEIQNTLVKNTPHNPKYYQALNYINFTNGFLALPQRNNNETQGLKIRIPIPKEDKITLELDRDDSWEVFFDEDGSLNIEILNFFSEYYTSFYKIKKEIYEKEKNALLNIINNCKNKKTSAIKPEEDVVNAFNSNKENQTNTYGESLLNSIMDDDTRKDFAIRRLNRIDSEFSTYSITLAKELVTVIKLSKQKDDSIDKSDFEDKISIATLLTYYNKEVKHNYSDLIFQLSRKENGNIDLEFCRLLIEMLTYCTTGINPEKEIHECADKILECRKVHQNNYKDQVEYIILKHQIGDINPF